MNNSLTLNTNLTKAALNFSFSAAPLKHLKAVAFYVCSDNMTNVSVLCFDESQCSYLLYSICSIENDDQGIYFNDNNLQTIDLHSFEPTKISIREYDPLWFASLDHAYKSLVLNQD